MIREVERRKQLIGRLNHGADLLKELTDICEQEGIQLGRLEALGAVQKACIGFYNQQTREYEYQTIERTLEILNVVGNVSIRDKKPIVHAHITLGDCDGKAFGGHLAPGTIVFACEYVIEILDGKALERGLDEETGLPLWTPQE
jgi:hypothetical protein